MLSFDTTKEERRLIRLVVKRAMAYCEQHAIEYEARTCDMDLTACHASGNPLDFQRLLDSDEFNFAHDVLGVRRHINRVSGELMDCFSPRCSKRQLQTA